MVGHADLLRIAVARRYLVPSNTMLGHMLAADQPGDDPSHKLNRNCETQGVMGFRNPVPDRIDAD